MDETKKILLKSLDSKLNADEKELLDKELQNSEHLKSQLKDYKSIRNVLSETNYSFGDEFSQKALNAISQRQSLLRPFIRTAVAAAAVILILVGSIWITNGSIGFDSFFGLESYPIEQDMYSLLNY